MKRCVFTAIFGPDTDPLHEPADTGGLDWLCFTDQPVESDKWRVVRMETKSDPCYQARLVKIKAAEVFDDYDASLWLDAAYEFTGDPNAVFEGVADIAALRHPDRSNVIEEGRDIVSLGKADAVNVAEQLEQYQRFIKRQLTLTTTGLLVRIHKPRVRFFNRKWMVELDRCGHFRDQMSVDYVAWRYGVGIQYLDGHYRDNPYAKWHSYCASR